MLSRALEDSPTSVVLWITYLVIYYSKTKPVGKDDMYPIAVWFMLFISKFVTAIYFSWLPFFLQYQILWDHIAGYHDLSEPILLCVSLLLFHLALHA